MQEPTSRITTIVKKYVRDPSTPIRNVTTLRELEIDLLDLPMICLDIEDIFDVQIRHDEEIEVCATVGSLISCVASHLEAKTLQPLLRTNSRPKRTWMSTGAERRR